MSKQERPPVENLEALLATYPDVTVQRERIGDIVVVEELPNKYDRAYYTSITQDSEQQPIPYVNISIRKIPKNKEGSWDQPYTYLRLKPVSEESVLVEVANKQSDIDVRKALSKVRQGFEIFDAFLRVPPIKRNRYNSKAYDWMGGHDAYQDLKDIGIFDRMKAAGLVDESHDLDNDWHYVYWMVKKNIVEVREIS